jgi:hypothetical protein
LAASPDNERESLRQQMRSMGLGVDEIAIEFSRRYRLRPREAYRVARGLTRQEAVDSFNGHVVNGDPRKQIRLTVEELSRYEGEACDRSLPSWDTLTLLAEVYTTDLRNLLDFNDRLLLSEGERLLIDRGAHDDSQPGPSISALLIGQAAAVLAVAVAVVYAAGALLLGFKLWFIQDTWAPVLGGLPRDLVLVNAISDVIPALIAAIPVYFLYYRWHRKRGRTRYLTLWRLLVVLVSAAVLALITGLFLFFTGHYFYAMVLRPWWEIVLTCFVINVIVIWLALYFLWLVDTSGRSQQLRRFFGVGIVALALIPCVASVYAAFPLPRVVLCGPAFYYSDADGRHYMVGNLIGSSGQWIYVAETRASKSVAFGRYISVVPLSAVNLETIGASAECHNLVPVRTGAKAGQH